MITGRVNADHEPVIQVRVCGSGGRELAVEAIVDTGFDGWLSLPSVLVAQLALPWRGNGRATLADGGKILFDFYEGSVLWDGELRRIQIDSAETDPLVGMALIWNHDVHFEAVTNGQLVIRRLRD